MDGDEVVAAERRVGPKDGRNGTGRRFTCSRDCGQFLVEWV